MESILPACAGEEGKRSYLFNWGNCAYAAIPKLDSHKDYPFSSDLNTCDSTDLVLEEFLF